LIVELEAESNKYERVTSVMQLVCAASVFISISEPLVE